MKKDKLITNHHQEEYESLEDGRDSDELFNDSHHTNDFIQKLTFLESLGLHDRQTGSHKMTIPRYQLFGKAAALSLMFNLSGSFTGVLGIILSNMFLHRQENTVNIDCNNITTDEANMWQDSATMFILTMSFILLMHAIEKSDINSVRHTASQARLSSFRKGINDYPIPAFLLTQLFLSLTDKAFIEKRSEKSMSDLSIIGVSGLGALYAICKVLKEDHLRLSYCVHLLRGCMRILHEKTSPCIERIQNNMSHIYEAAKPSLFRCMNKVEMVSKPVIEDIESYLNSSTVDSHDFVRGKMN